MPRTQIFDGLFAALIADPALVTLLGPSNTQNMRLYRNYPQFQSMLTGNGRAGDRYEPQGKEGWLVIEEPAPGLRAATQQFETIYQTIEVIFHIYATAYSLADDVSSFLDATFNWSVFQQRDVLYGDNFLLFARRFQTEEKYSPDVKLYHKTYQYRMEFVLAEQVA